MNKPVLLLLTLVKITGKRIAGRGRFERTDTMGDRDARRSARRLAWGCIMLTAIMAAGANAAETDIKFSLNSGFDGPVAPILLPLDKGYYKAEGVNLSIETATSPTEPIARVASGYYDMGVADINALIKFRDAQPGTPVQAIFMVYNRPPFAIIGRKSRGINKPKDLEGKKIGAPAADPAFTQWPIFAQANGINSALVAFENISAPVRDPMIAAGQIDAVTALSFSFIDLKDKGVPVDDIAVMLMSDYGVELYGDAVIVNTKFAAERPEAVKAFLRAFLKGLKETVRSPASAIDAVLKRTDLAKKEVELERLKMAIRDNIATMEVKANGYGGVDAARFATAVDQIGLTYKFKSEKPKLDDIFNATFLPSAADRKF
jgi:NitT/TauT family transport system substrate-binding protein